MAALKALHPDREARGYSQKRTVRATRKKRAQTVFFGPGAAWPGAAPHPKRLPRREAPPHNMAMNAGVFAVLMLLAAAALPAAALAQVGPPGSNQEAPLFQTPGLDLGGNTQRTYTPEEQERMKEIDKDYRATLKKLPDKPQAYDPWAGARPAKNK